MLRRQILSQSMFMLWYASKDTLTHRHSKKQRVDKSCALVLLDAKSQTIDEMKEQ